MGREDRSFRRKHIYCRRAVGFWTDTRPRFSTSVGGAPSGATRVAPQDQDGSGRHGRVAVSAGIPVLHQLRAPGSPAEPLVPAGTGGRQFAGSCPTWSAPPFGICAASNARPPRNLLSAGREVKEP